MMSRVPMLSDEARVFSDPAYAVQHQMLLMGSGADLIATRIGASREDCDAIALGASSGLRRRSANIGFSRSFPSRHPTG